MNIKQKLTNQEGQNAPKTTPKMTLLTLQIFFGGLASTIWRCLLGFFGLLGSFLVILGTNLASDEN